MKKSIKIINIIFSVIFIKLILIFTINEIVISNYHNKIYNMSLINSLYFFTYNQSYIVYYNHGNILYNQKNYQEAINKYKQALTKNPPQKRVCDIRINLALSFIETIDLKDTNETLDILKEARYNLYENKCVDPNYENSYSLDAEDLEKEIKKLEEELSNTESNQNNNNDNDDHNNDDDSYKEIEEKIKENEKQANANRRKNLNDSYNLDNYEYYNGKRW